MESIPIPENLVCQNCGENDFYENTGFFFCNECGTQANALKELAGTHVTDNEFSRHQRAKIIKKPKVEKEKETVNDELNQLTSWECFNYIIAGLADELIKLGATSTLKKTIHTLWMKYLVKLEVLRIDAAPKLGVSSWKKDAKILYNYKETKVTKSRSKYLYENADKMSKESLKFLKQKQRRSAIMENYNNCTLLEKSDASIMEFEPENVLNSTTKLEFNASITNEMNKKRKRSEDGDGDDSVGKLNTNSFTGKFLDSAENLSRNKLFSIIYLSLLIGNEEIQLGDMLRFIKEGHLSYYKVDHFLPNMKKDYLNIQNWNHGHTYLSNFYLRESTFKIAKYLEVEEYIPCQNLIRLCERYCKEMNLPASISDFIINLMANLNPSMPVLTSVIPNYEGRIMCLIMFTLKLFFGLDDKTEFHLSTYAEMLNKREDIDQKMFVWKDWIYYIYYRKLVLIQHHFPTQYVFDNEGTDNVNLFIEFLENTTMQCDDDFEPNDIESEVLKKILEQLNQNDHQKETNENFKFSASLVPFRDYMKVLLSSNIPKRKGYLLEILNSNFDETSLKFLTDCDSYLEKLMDDTRVEIKERGAHKDMQVVSSTNVKSDMARHRANATKQVSVKIVDEEDEGPSQSKNEDGTYVVYPYKLEDKLSDINSNKKGKYTHYKPYKTYWSKTTLNILDISKDNSKAFVRSLPDSFQLVLNECGRIIEQEPHVLMEEFIKVETLLCRITNVENLNSISHTEKGLSFRTLLKNAFKSW